MKKKKIKKTFGSKHIDNLKLLFSNGKLIEKINQIRSVLEISTEMYCGELSDEEKNLLSKKWTEDTAERSDKIQESKHYNNALKIIGESLKNNGVDIKEAKERSEKINLMLPFNYLSKSIEDIMAEYNIPEHYKNSLRHYIFFGSIQWAPALPFSVKMFNKNNKTVTLEIYEELTDKDLVELKKYVNVYFGKNLPQIRPIHNVDLKLISEEKYDNRKYVDSVDFTDCVVKKEDIAENIEEETGEYIDPEKIYDYSREIKKLRNKRFGKK
ncbi:MAG: hypothetical protein WCX46_04785 [Candidatus Paceibacterota bacterium]